MTIFLDVAKTIIREKITAIIDGSREYDTSSLYSSLAYIGIGRDQILANEKRDLLTALTTTIDSLEDRENDEATLGQFLRVIHDCLEKIQRAARKAGQPRGTTENELERLSTILGSSYKALSDLNICNIPHDADPLNIFRYYVALYFTRNIIRHETPTTFESFKANVKPLSDAGFLLKQEDFVKRALIKCTENIDALAPSHAHYLASKTSFVLSEIDQLIRANAVEAAIDSKSRLGFFGSYILPNDHNLVRCLHDAQAHIAPSEFFMPEAPDDKVPGAALPPSEVDVGATVGAGTIDDPAPSVTLASSLVSSQALTQSPATLLAKPQKRTGGKQPASVASGSRPY